MICENKCKPDYRYFCAQLKYAIVDIETTGGNFKTGRITEVAVFLHNGNRMLDSYTTLVNPEMPISPFVSELTGITNKMVQDAPTFPEIADKLLAITENAIFVAHNVNFDYNYLREGYRNLGIEFKRKKLCTVQLSRQAFPGLPSYSLDKITRQLGIELPGHHRAAVDAEATMILFEKILAAKSEEGLFDAHFGIPDLTGISSPHIDTEFLESIPDECGVFRFYNRDDEVLYVKRAENMLSSICEKLKQNETQLSKNLRHDLYRIDYEETGSGLIAQLIEAHDVKSLRPEYNFGKFSMKIQYGLYLRKSKPYDQLVLLKCREGKNAQKVFGNFYEGLDYLKLHASEVGSEITQMPYGRRTAPGIAVSNGNHASNGSSHYIIVDEGRKVDERALVLVRENKVLGFGFYDTLTPRTTLESADLQYKFNDHPELEMVIRKFIEKKRYEQILNLKQQ